MFNKTTLIKTFAERYGIKPFELGQHEREAAYWLEYSEMLVAEAVQKEGERLDQNPTWGILWRMIERSNRHAGNGLVLSTLGQPASGEVLARTVLESAINVLYLLHANTPERLNAYFASYIATERKQNEGWKKSIKKLANADEIAQHRVALKQKEDAVEFYEKFIREASSGLGVAYNPKAQWMTTADRFIAVNHEVPYRTIYAALCSQTHGDAEDLLNELVIVLASDQRYKKMLRRETENFSRMLIYSAIYFQLETVGTFGYVHKLKAVANEMVKGYAEVSKIAQYYAKKTIE